MTTDFTLWMETCTGRRTLLASSSCQTLALLVGEAVWAHFWQIRATSLDVNQIEVHRRSSSCESDVPTNMPHIVARWSASGREKLLTSNTSPSMPASETSRTPSLTTSCRDSHPQAVAQQETDLAESSGLAAFFPTKEEWASWNAWRRRKP